MFDKLPVVHPSPALLALDAAIVAVFCAVAVAWLRHVWRRGHNRSELAVHAIYVAYLVALFSIVFLPLHGLRAAAHAYEGTQPLSRAWSWGLKLYSPLGGGQLHWTRVANVALTIPFGFGFGLLAPRIGVRRIFVACIAWAVSLELIQLAISLLLGIVYRTFDINDIIDNAFGAWIGLAGFVVCALVVRRWGLGADAPETTLRGFVARSVGDYFRAHQARASRDRDELPAPGP